jgi:aspartate-semialdehyde dehydrogenase
VKITEFDLDAARKLDIVFLAVGGDFSKQYAHKLGEGVRQDSTDIEIGVHVPMDTGAYACRDAWTFHVQNGPVVIDNSSAFRMEADVPLVVPEINQKTTKGKKLIANPNCTTAIALMALYPLHLAFGLKRVIMSTYQAASGAGAEGKKNADETCCPSSGRGSLWVIMSAACVFLTGMDELKTGIASFVKGEPIKNEFFAYPLPFNVIPHIDVFQENGYTKEEMKVTWETQKILGVKDLPVRYVNQIEMEGHADEVSDDVCDVHIMSIPRSVMFCPPSCTAVRIPTLRAHSEAITIETEKPITPEAARYADC